jgi:hypothetical protein
MTMKNFYKAASEYLPEVAMNDVLHFMGLTRRRSAAAYVVPAIGLVGVGLIAGAAIGLMLATESGEELRTDLKEKVKEFQNKLANGKIENQGASSI